MTPSASPAPLRRYTFPKSEHLCLRKQIETLFGHGSSSRSAFPLRAVWRVEDAEVDAAAVLMMVDYWIKVKRIYPAEDLPQAEE